jgi:hypothetical protein
MMEVMEVSSGDSFSHYSRLTSTYAGYCKARNVIASSSSEVNHQGTSQLPKVGFQRRGAEKAELDQIHFPSSIRI